MLTGEQLGKAIGDAIDKMGVSKVAVAAHFGVKPPSVQDWVRRGTISKEKLPILWEYFKSVAGPEHWGLTDFPTISGSASTGSSAGATLTTQANPIPVSTPGALPVVGTARLGDDGHYYELEFPVGHGDGFVRYPSGDKNAYAVRCKGESMAPRIRHGEYAVVEPNHPVVPGDEVLVRSKDGRVMIKVFAYARDGMVHLDSINNNHQIFPRISLLEDEVAAMQYVAGTAKSALWFEASEQHVEAVGSPEPAKSYVGKDIRPHSPATAAKKIRKAG